MNISYHVLKGIPNIHGDDIEGLLYLSVIAVVRHICGELSLDWHETHFSYIKYHYNPTHAYHMLSGSSQSLP